MVRYKALVLIMALFLAACSGTQNNSPADTDSARRPQPILPNLALFTPTAPAPSSQALFSLTPEQETAFLEWYRAETRADRPGHQRLRDYLRTELVGFDYVAETLSPSEALARHEGNCMSLAALTYSLSRLVGLEHRFQLVNTRPVFDRNRRVLISSSHVRSRVYDPTYRPSDGAMVLQRPHIIVDYFSERAGLTGSPVSDAGFLAMYYRNLSVEALLRDDINRAFTLVRAALRHQPDRADALNLLAVLHRRAGDPVTAESLYEYVLAVHGGRADVLNNYANLLRSEGREDRARQIEQELRQLDDGNPFHWVALGRRAQENGSLEMALKWFEAAIERAPNLHEAYWRAAAVHRELGHPQRSAEYLRMAVTRAHRGETRERYASKLETLTNHAPF